MRTVRFNIGLYFYTAREQTTVNSARTKPNRRLGGRCPQNDARLKKVALQYLFLYWIVSAELIELMGVGQNDGIDLRRCRPSARSPGSRCSI